MEVADCLRDRLGLLSVGQCLHLHAGQHPLERAEAACPAIDQADSETLGLSALEGGASVPEGGDVEADSSARQAPYAMAQDARVIDVAAMPHGSHAMPVVHLEVRHRPVRAAGIKRCAGSRMAFKDAGLHALPGVRLPPQTVPEYLPDVHAGRS